MGKNKRIFQEFQLKSAKRFLLFQTKMNNGTDFFVTPLQTIHFASIFSSMNILSNIFFRENLLARDDVTKQIPIVNSLCEYLHRNNNTENVTISLGKQLLNNTSLYGSRENETIHIDYVNAMLDHIITSLVFSKFGNTFGYLGAIVNGTHNLTLSYIKRKIKKDLSEQKFYNPDYSVSMLNFFSIKRITERLIFPLFPDHKNLQITDTDYLYAQAGLMFTRSLKIDSPSPFEEYVTIAESIEQGVRYGQLNDTALKIFQLPAMLYYVNKTRGELKKNFHLLVDDADFWNATFNAFFGDLNVEQETIADLQKSNPANQFQKAFFAYRNRTEYAEYLIRRMCPELNESEYEDEVTKYKYNNAEYYCKLDNFRMPDVNELFKQQNEFIATLYSYVEKHMLQEAFSKELIEFILKPNTTITGMKVPLKDVACLKCAYFHEKINSNAIVFQIIQNHKNPVNYALISNESTVILLEDTRENHNKFIDAIGLSPNTELIPDEDNSLKAHYQSFDKFLANLVEPKRIDFYQLLHNMNYEATTGETIVTILKNFIPFYNCIKASITESLIKAICTCMIDSLILIPFVGQAASIGYRVANAAIKPLLISLQNSMMSFSIGQIVAVTLRTGIINLASQSARGISALMTRDLFKNIGFSVVRALDPGLELSYTLGKAGLTSLAKFFTLISQKISSMSKIAKSLTKLKEPMLKQVAINEKPFFVNSINGNDGYGVKFLQSDNNNNAIELRRIRGYENEMPVVLISDPNSRKRIYKIIDPETGELRSTNWEMNAEGILVVEQQSLAVRLKTIQVEGLSGRGRIINPRIQLKKRMIDMRNDYIKEYGDRIDKSIINNVLRNYVLDDEVLRVQVFNHIIDNREVPDWIKFYKLSNVGIYDKLRYNSYVEDVLLTSEDAAERVSLMFKNKYRADISEIRPDIMYELYTSHRMFSIVSFEDFYSIGTYLQQGGRVLENPEGWFIQNAFNKLAMRYVDFPAFETPTSFYRLEVGSMNIVNTHVNGNSFKINRLTNIEKHISDSLNSAEFCVFDGNNVNVLYEIVIDHSYMAVDIESLTAGLKAPVILLPGTEFVIESAGYELISDKLVYKITMKNIIISKSKWLVNLNKNIDTLNQQILEYNNVIDDFNLDLFN